MAVIDGYRAQTCPLLNCEHDRLDTGVSPRHDWILNVNGHTNDSHRETSPEPLNNLEHDEEVKPVSAFPTTRLGRKEYVNAR
jgi:hypothetical protein